MELDQSQARKGSSQETIDVQSRDNARAVEGYSRQPGATTLVVLACRWVLRPAFFISPH